MRRRWAVPGADRRPVDVDWVVCDRLVRGLPLEVEPTSDERMVAVAVLHRAGVAENEIARRARVAARRVPNWVRRFEVAIRDREWPCWVELPFDFGCSPARR